MHMIHSITEVYSKDKKIKVVDDIDAHVFNQSLFVF